MLDPEDNVKAALAEIAVSDRRRRYWTCIAWFALGILITFGAMIEVILTVHTQGWWTIGLIVCAGAAIVSGVLMARSEYLHDGLAKAKDVHRQWDEEIKLQNREVEREHEDGEPA